MREDLGDHGGISDGGDDRQGATTLGVVFQALASAAGLLMLGVRTVRFLQVRLGFAGDHIAIRSAAALYLASAIVALAACSLLSPRVAGVPLVACAMGSTAFLFLGYLLILRRLRVQWLLQIEARLTGRGAPS